MSNKCFYSQTLNDSDENSDDLNEYINQYANKVQLYVIHVSVEHVRYMNIVHVMNVTVECVMPVSKKILHVANVGVIII